MGLGHVHSGPAHGLAHDPANGGATVGGTRRRLGLVLAITAAILLAELVGAVLTGSLALLTDAAHMLVDVGGLTMAFLAAGLVRRPATTRRTWGLRRVEVLAAGAQALLLAGVGVYGLGEGIRRLFAPPEVPGGLLLVFGVIGLAGNIAGLLLLRSRRADGLNLRAAFLEVAADALGSVAVIAAALVIHTTGWGRADAVAGILIALVIVPRALVILRAVVRILLESVPEEIELAEVRRHLADRPEVLGVHDLHIALIDSRLPVLTAHVVVAEACFESGRAGQVLRELRSCLAAHFSPALTHTTLQLEPAGDAAECTGAAGCAPVAAPGR